MGEKEELEKLGKLLWQEPKNAVQYRRKMVFIIGFGLLVIGLIMAPLGLIFSSFLLLLYSALLFVSGLMFILLRNSFLPFRIYENGILFSSKLMDYRFFISWGEITKISEMKILANNYYIIENRNKGKLRIRKDLPELPELFESKRSLINKEEYIVDVYGEKKIRSHKKLEFLLYPLVFILSIFLSFIIVATNYEPSLQQAFWIMGFGFGVPLITVTLLGFCLYMLADWRSKFLIRLKVDLKTYLVMVVIMNMIFISVGGAVSAILPNEYSLSEEFRKENAPDDFWEGGTSLNGGTFNLYDSLFVPSGMEFTISDSLVVFGGDGDLGIYVEDSGHLIIENSSIASHNPEVGYWFEVYGRLTVSNSIIQHVWGDPDYENMDGGIELYNAQATFEDSNIQYCITNGILASESDIALKSCNIENCPDDGLELHDSTVSIEDCLFRYNGWPIMFWEDSEGTVSNCTFTQNEAGMFIVQSSPKIENCVFTDTASGPAVTVMGPAADPILENNTFSNNDDDVDYPSLSSTCCYIVSLPMLSLVLIILIYWKNRRIMI